MKLYNSTYYHGSRMAFDHFDFQFMSSGEGQQIHGWGIYLAANKDVGEYYRNTFQDETYTTWNITVDGQSFEKFYKAQTYITKAIASRAGIPVNSDPYFMLMEYVADYFNSRNTDPVSVYQSIKDGYEKRLSEHSSERLRLRISILDAIIDYFTDTEIKADKTVADDKATLFTVNVDDDCVFIDENDSIQNLDKELQHSICNAVREVQPNYESLSDVDIIASLSVTFGDMGYDKVKAVISKFGFHSPEKLSMALLHNGIDGITYYGNQDRECLVLFNLDKCRIVEKE